MFTPFPPFSPWSLYTAASKRQTAQAHRWRWSGLPFRWAKSVVADVTMNPTHGGVRLSFKKKIAPPVSFFCDFSFMTSLQRHRNAKTLGFVTHSTIWWTIDSTKRLRNVVWIQETSKKPYAVKRRRASLRLVTLEWCCHNFELHYSSACLISNDSKYETVWNLNISQVEPCGSQNADLLKPTDPKFRIQFFGNFSNCMEVRI